MQNNLSKFALEPALFLLFFGWYLSWYIITNQLLKQTCLFTFEYEPTICANLGDSKNVEQTIQPYVANILMTISILNSTITIFLSLFLGQWSDKFGRKKVINCIFVGFTISMAITTAISYSSENFAVNNPWYYLFAHFPYIIFGGWPTLIVIMTCYLTDQTTAENRSYRFVIVELIIFTGVIIAFAASSFLLKATSAPTVFAISFVCIFTGTLIEIFLVEESVKNVNKDVNFWDQFNELFSLQYVREIIKTFKKKRDVKRRRILWTLTFIFMFTQFGTNGSTTILYLFVRQKFSWTLFDLTIFESSAMLMTLFGAVFSLFVFKRMFQLSDLTISILAMISSLLNAIVTTFAYQSWMMYFGAMLGCLKIVAFPMLRSLMSTMVNENEASKIYSLSSSLESVSGLGAAPFYTAVYSATINTFPSAFNLITVGILTLSVSLALLIVKWIVDGKRRKVIITKM